MTDTATDSIMNRGSAHYPECVPTDDELTVEEQAAVNAVNARVREVLDAEVKLKTAMHARAITVQEHAATLRAMGWRRAVRAIGSERFSESTLRADAARRVDGDA